MSVFVKKVRNMLRQFLYIDSGIDLNNVKGEIPLSSVDF